MENIRTGPLPLNFTSYYVKAVYVDCRMDFILIIEAIGSTLEEIEFQIDPHLVYTIDWQRLCPNWATLLTAIRNHYVNLHTLHMAPLPRNAMHV